MLVGVCDHTLRCARRLQHSVKRPKQDPDFKSGQSPVGGHGHSKWQDNTPSPQLHPHHDPHHDPYEFSDEASSNAGSFRKRAFRNSTSRDDSFTRAASFTGKVSRLVSSFLSFFVVQSSVVRGTSGHFFPPFYPVCYVVLSQPSNLHVSYSRPLTSKLSCLVWFFLCPIFWDRQYSWSLFSVILPC